MKQLYYVATMVSYPPLGNPPLYYGCFLNLVSQLCMNPLRCLLFHGDGGHIGGQNCIESMEAALQYGRHHHG